MDLTTLQKELEACVREIHDIQSSGASRSHAGPTLALRSLINKYHRLKEQIGRLSQT
jgi:hypothetical protein